VKDRGTWYDPPTEHLGLPVKDGSPLRVAEHALAFYRELVRLADEKFSA
jgi:hypothetical protein